MIVNLVKFSAEDALNKSAAVREYKNEHGKFELRWEVLKEFKKDPDGLFNLFSEIYDRLSQEGSDKKPFTVMIGGKSYKIDPNKYGYFDKTLKTEIEKNITKDYGDKGASPCCAASSVKKYKKK